MVMHPLDVNHFNTSSRAHLLWIPDLRLIQTVKVFCLEIGPE